MVQQECNYKQKPGAWRPKYAAAVRVQLLSQPLILRVRALLDMEPCKGACAGGGTPRYCRNHSPPVRRRRASADTKRGEDKRLHRSRRQRYPGQLDPQPHNHRCGSLQTTPLRCFFFPLHLPDSSKEAVLTKASLFSINSWSTASTAASRVESSGASVRSLNNPFTTPIGQRKASEDGRWHEER